MNKKVFVIGGVIGFLLILIINKGSNNLIENNIEIVEVKRDTFIYDYKTFGIVDSKSHYLFFNGYIKKIYKNPKSEIKKNEKILNYVYEYDKSKDLVSVVDGFIFQIDSNCVIIKDLNYYVVVELTYEKYSLLQENDRCFVGINNHYHPAEIIEKVKYDNQENKYKVLIKTEYDELIYYQHVNVTFQLTSKEGLIVDKRALYYDTDGYYLIAKGFKEELNNLEKYKIPIQVIMSNEKLALISGIALENKEVCIISEELRKILND